MEILIQAGQFILSLSLLIVLHEMGHFIPAKLFKTKVEKFYLFFDPYFSLFKKKIGETEYGIGWLPLGGYVKIAGMIDESMDKDQMAKPPQPWEFRSKPAWQRLIIMIGGVTVNVILAIVIYTGMMMYYGEEVLPIKNLEYGLQADSTAKYLGFETGDVITSIDGTEIENFREIQLELLLGDGGNVTVLRDGQEKTISITDEQKGKIISSKVSLFSFRFPFVIGGFSDTAEAEAKGLRLGDSIVSIGGKPMFLADEIQPEIRKYKGQTMAMEVYRDGFRQELNVLVSDSGVVGIMARNPLDFNYIKTEKRTYSFAAAVPAGINQSKKVLTDYIRQLGLIFTPETGAYKEVGGFLMIAKQFDPVWNWQKFWGFTAFLSVMLAFLNILPIPALDGGHVVFVLGEMITGRKPSEKLLERAQIVGFVILLALLLYVNGNDVIKAIMG